MAEVCKESFMLTIMKLKHASERSRYCFYTAHKPEASTTIIKQVVGRDSNHHPQTIPVLHARAHARTHARRRRRHPAWRPARDTGARSLCMASEHCQEPPCLAYSGDGRRVDNKVRGTSNYASRPVASVLGVDLQHRVGMCVDPVLCTV